MVALRKAEPVNELEDLLRRFLLNEQKAGRYEDTAMPAVMAMLEALEHLTTMLNSDGVAALIAARKSSEALPDVIFELEELLQRAKECEE